jgi:hypothetical protein
MVKIPYIYIDGVYTIIFRMKEAETVIDYTDYDADAELSRSQS